MSRARPPRVRTGCITCKNRKVKCDEAKPACNRCTSIGRHCDGYITAPNDPANPVRLLLPRHVSPIIRTTAESRALQFFFHVAGPSISGGIESSFWAHVVMRSSTSELAVKHAVVAISSLYEVVEGRYEPDTIDLPRLWNTAIQHYSTAIREFRTMENSQTLSSVLLVCALFVCIEVLCDNRELAVQHCRHGLKLLRSGLSQSIPIQEDIISAFRQLSVLLFYFGDDWDVLSNTRTLEDSSLSSFSTLSDAEDMLDMEVLRTARLVYQTAPYRSSLSGNSFVPQHLLAEQASINRHLDVWSNCIFNMKDGVPGQKKGQPAIAKPRNKSEFQSTLLRCFLLTHYECCRIWVNMAFSASESGYDRMYPNFRRALDYLLEIGPEPFPKLRMDGQSSLAFTMDNGFGALLFFLLTACRHLPTRLEFLRLLPIFMHRKEKFWERDKLLKTAKSIIEVEHGIQLDASDQSVEVTNRDWPPEHMRISSMWAGPGEENIFILKIHSNHSGQSSPFSRSSEE